MIRISRFQRGDHSDSTAPETEGLHSEGLQGSPKEILDDLVSYCNDHGTHEETQ
jgi:hypothetical protein